MKHVIVWSLISVALLAVVFAGLSAGEDDPEKRTCHPVIEIDQPGSCPCGCYAAIDDVSVGPTDGCDQRMCEFSYYAIRHLYIAEWDEWRHMKVGWGGTFPCGYKMKVWVFCPHCDHYLTQLRVGCSDFK